LFVSIVSSSIDKKLIVQYRPDFIQLYIDRSGEAQDLVVMTADMKEFWNDLESFYHGTDWERCK
jgi:hypothetical protein